MPDEDDKDPGFRILWGYIFPKGGFSAKRLDAQVWALGGGLDPGQQMQCQFPFTFEGKKYEECARNVEPPPSGGAWSVPLSSLSPGRLVGNRKISRVLRALWLFDSEHAKREEE